LKQKKDYPLTENIQIYQKSDTHWTTSRHLLDEDLQWYVNILCCSLIFVHHDISSSWN